jgi:hypothetical protein
MTTTAEIREELIIQYPQMYDIAEGIFEKIQERTPSTTETVVSILNKFISKSSRLHDETTWGDSYIDGVMLLTCHFLIESQPKAVNSGMVVREKNGSESETEYLRPALKNFGQYSTTKYGRAWEALKSQVCSGEFILIV